MPKAELISETRALTGFLRYDFEIPSWPKSRISQGACVQTDSEGQFRTLTANRRPTEALSISYIDSVESSPCNLWIDYQRPVLAARAIKRELSVLRPELRENERTELDSGFLSFQIGVAKFVQLHLDKMIQSTENDMISPGRDLVDWDAFNELPQPPTRTIQVTLRYLGKTQPPTRFEE